MIDAVRARVTRRVVLVVLLGGLVLLLGAAAGAALQARSELLAARDGLKAAQDGTGSGASDGARLNEVTDAVAAAAADARDARRLMRGPAPALLARVPVLGRSLAAERDVAEAAAAALTAAERLVPLVRDLQVDGGSVDLARVEALSVALGEAAETVRRPVEQLDRSPLGLTPAPVGDAVREARGPLSGLADALDRGAAGSAAAAGLLGADGPRSLVVAVMNNAELRGAGGYASSFTVLRAEGGQITLAPFQDTNEVFDPPESAVRVDAPEQFARRWGPLLADTTLGKNALVSAHAPDSAEVLCAAVRLRVEAGCDGVVLIDVPALADLITLTGPVQLPDGTTIGGGDLVRELLVDAYAELAAADDSGEQRRRALRTAADDGLARVLSGGLTGVDALRALTGAARGRHLAVWSADDAEQRRLVEAGVAGAADPAGADLGLVAMNQFGASKLDFYADRRLTLEAVVGPDSARVISTVSLALDTPDGLPPYVVGSSQGRLVGVLDVGIGAGATVVSVERDGQPLPVSVLDEAGGRRVPLVVDVADGAQTTWQVVYDVPVEDGRYRLRLLPQPLAHDAHLDLRIEAADGLELDGGPVTRSGPLDAAATVEVRAQAPSWWERPVRLGTVSSVR